MRLFRRILCFVVLTALLCALYGTLPRTARAAREETAPITSYRDIPGITAEEIASIEAVLATRTVFRYAVTPGTASFTTERDTLSLTAGESLRLTVEQMLNAQNLSGFVNSALNLRLRGLAELKAERHVIINRHVGVKCVVLENHRDVAILRCNVVYQLVANVKLAFGDFFKTGDHTKSGGFSAAGRTDQNDKFLIFDFQSEVANSRNAACVHLIKMLKGYTCHVFFLLKGL